MTNPDAQDQPLHAVLHDAFDDLIGDELVDIVALDEEDACEVQADSWTLYVEGWPVGTAWIALDDDTSTEDEHREALESALGPRDFDAMRQLNALLDGNLVPALTASGDELSATFADMLAASDPAA